MSMKNEWVTPDEHNSRDDDSRRACLMAMGDPDKRCLREEGHDPPCDRPPMFDALSYRRNARPVAVDTISDLGRLIHEPETKEDRERFVELEQRFAIVLAKHQGLPGGAVDKNFDDHELANSLAQAVFYKPDPPLLTLAQVAHDAFQYPLPIPWDRVDPKLKLAWGAAAVAVYEAAAERETPGMAESYVEDAARVLREVYGVLTNTEDVSDMMRVQVAVELLKEAKS